MKRDLWLLCATVMMLTACASPVVVSVWKDEAATAKLNKVFVLAVLKEPAYRDAVEYGIADILNEDRLRAIPTLDNFPKINEIDKAVVAKMVKEYGIDGVLIIRLVERKLAEVPASGASYYGPLYANRFAGGWYDYYGDGYNAFGIDDYATANYISTVETTIYDLATDKVRWTTVTKTKGSSVTDSITSYLDTIEKSLADSGLF